MAKALMKMATAWCQSYFTNSILKRVFFIFSKPRNGFTDPLSTSSS